MDAILTIQFKKVNNITLDKNLMKGQIGTNLMKSTDTVMKKLCETIEKYFKEKNIEVKVDYNLVR